MQRPIPRTNRRSKDVYLCGRQDRSERAPRLPAALLRALLATTVPCAHRRHNGAQLRSREEPRGGAPRLPAALLRALLAGLGSCANRRHNGAQLRSRQEPRQTAPTGRSPQPRRGTRRQWHARRGCPRRSHGKSNRCGWVRRYVSTMMSGKPADGQARSRRSQV